MNLIWVKSVYQLAHHEGQDGARVGRAGLAGDAQNVAGLADVGVEVGVGGLVGEVGQLGSGERRLLLVGELVVQVVQLQLRRW